MLKVQVDFRELDGYVCLYEGDESVTLDGEFTIEELEKIVAAMRLTEKMERTS